MVGDWIKIHRRLLEHPILQHAGLSQLWLYCLLKANWKDSYWLIPGTTHVKEVPAGSFVTGRESLHHALYGHASKDEREVKAPSQSTVWRWLQSLERMGCVKLSNMNNRCTLVSIVKYREYQSNDGSIQTADEQPMNSRCTTAEQPVNNRRTTGEQPVNTVEESKESKEREEVNTNTPPLPPVRPNGQLFDEPTPLAPITPNHHPVDQHSDQSKGVQQHREECLSKRREKSQNVEGFDLFWKAYPKRVAKASALKAWNKLKPDAELLRTILDSIPRHAKTDQWTRESGQFIPLPATWLNGRRWEDQLETVEEEYTFAKMIHSDGRDENGVVKDPWSKNCGEPDCEVCKRLWGPHPEARCKAKWCKICLRKFGIHYFDLKEGESTGPRIKPLPTTNGKPIFSTASN